MVLFDDAAVAAIINDDAVIVDVFVIRVVVAIVNNAVVV